MSLKMQTCRLFNNIRYLNTHNFITKLCVVYEQKLYMSAKAPQTIASEIDAITGEVRKKKIVEIPKITLLTGDNIQVTTLENAQKLSKRRDLKLVKIIDLDTKSNRPVYKLMTGSEYHAEDLKHKEVRKAEKANSNYIKGEKLLMLNSRVSKHDLDTFLAKVVKWINKMYEVRVVINFANSSVDLAENIYKAFENHFKSVGNEAKFVQKRNKGIDMKFQILPPNKKKGGDGGL